MKIALFYHSLESDWNNGNAHFLRGIASELLARGHDVRIFEPEDSWSRENLVQSHGEAPVQEFHEIFPHLSSIRYDDRFVNIPGVIGDRDLVIVHEWNNPGLVARIGAYRRRHPHFLLMFHDTHHRAHSHRDEMAGYDLSGYDGVLAFGSIIRDIYLANGWIRNAWVWHEAADICVFHPRRDVPVSRDIVWIGNWGDDERTAEYEEFLLSPVRELGLRGEAFGVRYPEIGIRKMKGSGLQYRGWLPNYRVPEVYAGTRMTVHIPRRYYRTDLPGIPTIRPFEALACGIPLISAPWKDIEGLFLAGRDYLIARDGADMKRHMRRILNDPDFAAEIAENGRRTIIGRHTCAHRVDELMEICGELEMPFHESSTIRMPQTVTAGRNS